MAEFFIVLIVLAFLSFVIFLIISSLKDDFEFPDEVQRLSDKIKNSYRNSRSSNFYNSDFSSDFARKKNLVNKTLNAENSQDDFYKKLDSGFFDDDAEILQSEDFETYQEIFGDDFEE